MPEIPYEGATAEQLRHPLVNAFLGIHNMFRDQLTAILEYVNDLIAGEQQLSGPETKIRTQSLIQAGMQYTALLHAHHHSETSTLFPALQAEGLQTAVVDRLNAEHDEIALLIDRFSAAIRDLSAIEPEVMNSDLRRLAQALHDHLAYEETHVCPFLMRFSSWNSF
jgi:hemerythrin-like domain-containing protein